MTVLLGGRLKIIAGSVFVSLDSFESNLCTSRIIFFEARHEWEAAWQPSVNFPTTECLISHRFSYSHFVEPLKMIRSTLKASKLASSVISRNNGAIRTMAGKDILFGVEGRAAMLRGVDILADAVQVRSLQDFHRRVPCARSIRTALYIRRGIPILR